MIYAKQAEGPVDLVAFAKKYHEENLEMSADFTEAEVVNCALSAWRYEERGENYYGSRGVVTCTPDIVDDLAIANADAFALLMVARRYHWENERGLASQTQWSKSCAGERAGCAKQGAIWRKTAISMCYTGAGAAPAIPPSTGGPENVAKQQHDHKGCDIVTQYY